MNMRNITPGEIATRDLHQFLLGCVAPRPIAWVSTIDEDGNANLAPYSFFNAFSSNPPIVVFSSNRRVSNNTTKDTLANIKSTREAVINMVSFKNVRQMAVSSIEFPSGVDEFAKAGLHTVPSELVRPPRVLESPAHLECKVREIITLGDQGGAGHLILCDVVKMHIAEEVIIDDRIDPHKIDLMGRMGRAYYTRASGEAIHTIVQPVTQLSIGYDQLPEGVQNSPVLTGNHIGRLAGLHAMPDETSLQNYTVSQDNLMEVHQLASEMIDRNEVSEALRLLLAYHKENND